ncbi:MAG: ABC transporter substrate-binding protein [Acidimicrobiales bacterium]
MGTNSSGGAGSQTGQAPGRAVSAGEHRRAVGSGRRRPAKVAAGLAAAGLLVAACGSTSAAKPTSTTKAPSTSAKPAKHYTIALVPGITTDPFYITMQNGAQAEAKALGVKLLWTGGTAFTPESQLPAVNALLASHPSALLIAPTNSRALVPAMKQFTSAGIPVLTVDTTVTKADRSMLVSRITSDNIQGGQTAAKTIAKLAGYKGSVAVINVSPGITTTDQRQTGFVDQIKKYPNMKVVSIQYDNDSPTTAATQASAIMLAHPHLVGIFGTNIYGAEGAGKAVSAAGKKGKVFVAGYDAEPAEVALLKQGVINVLVVQNPALEGKLAVQYAYDYLTGKKGAIKTNVLLPNIIATTSNASSPSIAKYFYKTSLAS